MALFATRIGQAQNRGYVQTDKIKIAGVTTDAQIAPLTTSQKQTTIVYLDGLGRAVQSIAEQSSPLQHDIIQPVAYDNLGRSIKNFLAYVDGSANPTGSFRTNALTTDQAAFYNNTSQYLVPTDAAPYTQQVFENSPLQRLMTAGTVGTGFQPGGHTKSVIFRPNNSTSDGNILQWNVDGTYTTGNYYANSTLSITDGKDEDNVETLVFTDLAGHTILKRQIYSAGNLDTYYIYNNAGMLIYIVPPKATGLLSANSYNLNTAPLSNLVFKFVYESTMGRLVQKTVPAKGVMYIVYDPMNRPVLLQDANMRANNNWNYIKYDVKGRAISQGIYNDVTHTSLSAMQSYVSGLNYSTTWYEQRTSAGTTTGYYTNSVFPTTGITPLSYAYFDDYDLLQNGTPFTYTSQGLTGENGATTAPIRGAPTMVWSTTVGRGLTGIWLLKVTFYDKRGNPIQTRSNNHVYNLGSATLTDISTSVPDFNGVPQISKVSKQTAASTTVTVQTTLTYDPAYRLSSVSQSYNGGTTNPVASYSYNELGQVIKKGLGYVSPSTWLQNVDFRYNIRGQLLSINNSKLKSDTGKTNSDTNDLFGMQMLYDQIDANLGNTASFDGKLTAVKWMSKDASGASSYERCYKYTYDQLNRYTASNYAERTVASTSTFSNNIGGFDESGITYDNAGNILTLNRNSSTQGTNSNVQIDNLTYTYSSTNPNQLQSVTDGTDINHTGAGFRNLTGSTGTYTYDSTNGNLTADPYKGIAIAYNVLNKTDKITFPAIPNRWIDYTYDASGSLIRKRQYDNISGVLTLQNTTDYIDGFVYVNNTLSYFPMPEGRVLNNGGTFVQEFVITDQQGNARVSFQNIAGVATVKQENSYYAFGLVMLHSPVAAPTTPNKQLYNGGSEWQNDFSNLPDYQQTFFRNYDAAIGRWVAVDPEAESAESLSSYQYANNNPVMNNDPLGNLAHYDNSQQQPLPYNTGSGTGICYCNSSNSASAPGDFLGNWSNEGAFDDGGPFSADGGAAGRAFWLPAEMNGGALDPASGNVVTLTNAGTISGIMNALQNGTTLNANISSTGFYSVTFSGDQINVNNPDDNAGLSGVIAFGQGNGNGIANQGNNGNIDWGGATTALVGMVGGIAEFALGAVTSEAGIGFVAIGDGGMRAILNSGKLAAYLSGDKQAGYSMPANFGALVGKIRDSSNGVPQNEIGRSQNAIGIFNDAVTLLFFHTTWTATALSAPAAIAGLVSDAYTVGYYYGKIK